VFVIHKHKFVAVIIVILQLMVTLNDHISATIGPLTEISASEFNSFRCLQVLYGEGRKPGVFMNPRVIPTSIAFWSGWRERMESSTEKTLRWNTIVIGDFLNLGGVSHECRQYQFLRYYNVTKGRRVSFNEKVISGFAVIHVV